MSWPTPQDYNEAIQSPQISFSDLELKQGTVEITSLGLPKPITGGFASVYHLKCKNRDWAVRCFLREFQDQRERYEAISRHLRTANLPYIVGFEFLAQGIRVKGNWYPILKMEWVRGQLLNEYIRTHLTQPLVFRHLADRWMAMVGALKAVGISHGDLQHGNILVVNDDFRLIDYDGMFVPSLAGKFSNEVGHRNYQHPQRTEFEFGPNIDNFSAWVIYVSLIALSIDPGLWTRMKGGDECLLFRREDFEEPFASQNVALLSTHPDQRLGALVGLFQSILYRSPEQVPPIDRQLQLDLTPSAPSVIITTKPEWLYGPPVENRSDQKSNSIERPAADATWVIDFLGDSETEEKHLQLDAQPGRVVLMSATILTLVIVGANVFLFFLGVMTIGWGSFGFISILAVCIGGGALLKRIYHRDPVVIEMIDLKTQSREESRNLQDYQQRVKECEKKKSQMRSADLKRQRDVAARLAQLRQKEQREKDQVLETLNRALKSINAKRTAINRDEAAALKALQDQIGSEITRLTNRIVATGQQESDEITGTLKNKRESALRQFLHSYKIEEASIYGIGPVTKSRMRYEGIRTAADIEYWSVRRVYGIGDSTANLLVAWQRKIASRAKLPISLTPQEITTIRTKYQTLAERLVKERDTRQQELTRAVDSVKLNHANQRKTVDKEEGVAKINSNQTLNAISKRYAPQYESINQEEARVTTDSNERSGKIDDEIRRLRKQMSDRQWQLAKNQRYLSSFRNVSFKDYIRTAAGLH